MKKNFLSFWWEFSVFILLTTFLYKIFAEIFWNSLSILRECSLFSCIYCKLISPDSVFFKHLFFILIFLNICSLFGYFKTSVLYFDKRFSLFYCTQIYLCFPFMDWAFYVLRSSHNKVFKLFSCLNFKISLVLSFIFVSTLWS